MKTATRKVVDTNQLDNQALRDYLSRSRRNLAVLCDYTAMEAYRGGVEKAFTLFTLLCEYPEQVVVLKGTQQVCRLAGRPAGLQRRLIHSRQTVGYPRFCRDLQRAHDGDQRLRQQLVEHWRESKKFLDDVLIPDCELLVERLDATVRGTFTEAEIRTLRGAQFRLNAAIVEKIITSVFVLAANLFQVNRGGARWPENVQSFRNIYPLRFALCLYTYVLEWISTGSNLKVATRNVRNDLIDVGVAAYATYFDGLLSQDGRANRIYVHADVILQTVLAPPFAGAKKDWLEKKRRESKEQAKVRYTIPADLASGK